MILFPINAKKPRKGDSTPEEMAKAVQLAGNVVMPVKPVRTRLLVLLFLSSPSCPLNLVLSFSSSPSGHFLLVLSLTHPLPLQVVKHARAMAITADIKKVDAFQTICQALAYMRL